MLVRGWEWKWVVCKERNYSVLEIPWALDSGRSGSMLGLIFTGHMNLRSHWCF